MRRFRSRQTLPLRACEARFDNLVGGAVFANLNEFAVTVNDFPSFGGKLFALMAVFVFVGVARIAEEPAGNLFTTANAQAVSADSEDFEVEEMIFANGDFGVEFRMRPIRIIAEAFAFEIGQFALNEVAINFRFVVRAASAAACFVQTTSKQKSIAGFVNEDLPSGFAVVESFGLVGIS